MTDLIRIEKSKLVKIVELARNNRGINIDDLLQLAMVDVEPEKIVEKEVAYEQEVIELDPDEMVAVKRRKTHTKRLWTTDEEKNFIKMFKKGLSYKYMSKILGRTESALRTKVYFLRKNNLLPDNTEKDNAYTKQEKDLFNYLLILHKEPKKVPKKVIEEVAENLNRTESGIINQLYLAYKEEF